MSEFEIIGIIGSVFIVSCLLFRTTTFKGTILMRSINVLGSLLFVAYGYLINAYSTLITNAFAVIINIYYLIREVVWHKQSK